MNPESLILDKLKEVIPFKFRLWNGVGAYGQVGKKKIYKKYSVLWYIDARDAMDKLDEVVWSDWSDDYKVLKNNLYCGVTILWKTRWDCGTESNTEQEKGEASDSFKRACVKRWLWRFLYTLPRLTITSEESKSNKYNITKFVRDKFKDKLNERYEEYQASIWKGLKDDKE